MGRIVRGERERAAGSEGEVMLTSLKRVSVSAQERVVFNCDRIIAFLTY